MLRKTYKILAVAITATACGGTVADGEAPPQAPTTQALDKPAAQPEAPRPTPAVEPGAVKPEPAQAPACDPSALNTALSNKVLDEAVREHERYRCLCDDDGYPLVGNINSKGATASQFCTALKEKDLL